MHSIPSEKYYRLYLAAKYKGEKPKEGNDYDEIRKLFGNSQKEIKDMVNNFENSITKAIRDSDYDKNNLRRFTNTHININNNISKEKYPSDIWSYLKKSFSNIIKILKKDPLAELNQEEITSILISRDYN